MWKMKTAGDSQKKNPLKTETNSEWGMPVTKKKGGTLKKTKKSTIREHSCLTRKTTK